MTQVILDFIKKIPDTLSVQKAFVLFLVVVVSGFVLNLFLTIFVNDYVRKNRLWFVFLGVATILFQTALCVYEKGMGIYPILLAGVCFLLFIPVFSPSGRRRKLKKEEMELARFLEQKIADANALPSQQKQTIQSQEDTESETPFLVDRLQTKPPIQLQKESPPDFTHVKNVLERLNYFPLTPNEKKQAKDLEITVKRIESGENTAELKNRVNDGLGALLKIMAKHGV